MESTNKRKPSRLKRIIVIVLSIFFFTASGLFIYAYSLLSGIKHTDISVSPLSSVESEIDDQIIISDKKVFKKPVEVSDEIVNIAVFGLDRRHDEFCRTDTIMILSINKDNKKIKLTSLMRDMYVKIPGKWSDRINAAYAYGGPGLAVNAINTNFDMNIKYYASVDFKGIQKLIDKLGGTDINVKNGEIEYLNSYISELNFLDKDNPSKFISVPGMQHLNGKQTLGYMRIRYYGNADYERTQRQRTVISQLFDKVKSAGVLKFPGLVSMLLPYIETNMSKTDILNLGISVLDSKDSIEQYRLPVDGTFKSQSIRGMSVLVPDLPANSSMLHEFIYNKKR